MKDKAIPIIIGIVFSIFIISFVLAQEESYPSEFTLTVGEEKVFSQQGIGKGIRVELEDIRIKAVVPSGYVVDVRIYHNVPGDRAYIRTLYMGATNEPIVINEISVNQNNILKNRFGFYKFRASHI